MSDMAKLEIPSIVVHNGTTGSGGGGGGGGGESPTGGGGGVVVVVGPRGHSGGCPRAMDHEQRVGGPRSGGPSLRSLRTLSKQEEFEEEDELAVESGGLSPEEGSGGGEGGGWRGSREGGSSGDERGVPSPVGAANGSGSKVKLLVRSHAVREETSPPPDPEAVHSFSPPAPSTAAVPSAPASPSALSVPPSSLLTVNTGSSGGSSRPSSRHRLRHQGSSQGSMDSSSPCLSRDSSTEQASILDGGGSSSSGGGGSSGDLQQFIIETLNRNYKDRMLMLKIEQEIVSLARDNKRTHHKFPPMSSYQRMLVHRVAAFFGMEHNVDSTGNAVVVSKGRLNGNGSSNNVSSNGNCSTSYGASSDGLNSPTGNNNSSLSPPTSTSGGKIRFPPIEPCLRDHIRDELLPEEPRRSILKRGDSSSFEEGAGSFKSPERQLSSESRRSKSFEEREEEYEKARKRIFNQDSPSSQEGICCCDSSGQRCSHEELHCWTGVGGGNGGNGGSASGSGSFLHPWSSSEASDPPHGSRSRHNQLRPSRLLKVESFESRESLRRTSSGFRPCVSKSYSFGGYSGSGGGGSTMGVTSSSGSGGGQLTRGDSISSTHSAGGRLLTKQDSSASSANSAHLSPSSSGYKTQSVRSDSSNTPSPSPTTLALIPSSQQQHSPHDQSQGPSPSPPLLSPPLHNQAHSDAQTETSPIPNSPPPTPQHQPGTISEDEIPGYRRNNVCTSQNRGTSPLPLPPVASEVPVSSSSTQCALAASSDVVHPSVPLGNNAVMWAVTSMESVPPGSVLINPQTGQPYVNSDGTIYRFNPANPPKIISAAANTSMQVNVQPPTITTASTASNKVESSPPPRTLTYACEQTVGPEAGPVLMSNSQLAPVAGQGYMPQPPAPIQQHLLTTVPQNFSSTNTMQVSGEAPGAVLGPGQPQFATPASSYGGSLLGQTNYPMQASAQETQKQANLLVQENPGMAVSELASYFMGMGLAAAAAAVASSNNGVNGNNGNMCMMSGSHPNAVAPAPIVMTPTSSCVTSTTSAIGLHCQQIPPPTPPPLPPVNPFAAQNTSWQPSVHPQTSNVQVPFYYVAPMGMSFSTGGVGGNCAIVDGRGGGMGAPSSSLTIPSQPAPPLATQPPPPASVPTPLSISTPLPNPSLPPMQQQHPPGHPMGSAVQGTSQAPCIMYQQYMQSTPPPPAPPPAMVQQVVGMGSPGTTPYSLMAPNMAPSERQPLVSSRPLSHTPFTMVGGGTSGAIGNGGGSGIYGAGGGDSFLPSPPFYSTLAAPSTGSSTLPYYGQRTYQQQNLPPIPATQLSQHVPTSQHQAITGTMIGQPYHANSASSQIRCPTPPQHLNISNQANVLQSTTVPTKSSCTEFCEWKQCWR
ncbi:hypothetical protein J437_LFUL000661 [Ladona fulva]|uniref:R3H domain-containing protein 1 n=1 Tax=Ladona fulva TaxID=123851 RepID=A0A8K0K4E1_LADFU|nr:hypothetical protein J437_LFUL000661 [Ladona fulva]